MNKMLGLIRFELCVLILAAGCGESSHSLNMGQPELISIGHDRISMVVEAASHPLRLPDSAGTITNFRGYLVSVPFQAESTSMNRTIVGPLWDIPGPTSSVAVETGAAFTAKDEADLHALPRLVMNASQELVKGSQHGTKLTIETLRITGGTARWDKSDRADRAIEPQGSVDERVESETGRYVLQKEKNGRVIFYDRELGKQIDDPWLESAWGAFLPPTDPPRISGFLSEDLKYLVLFFGNHDLRPEGKFVTDVTVNGQTYPCENHGVIFERPAIQPQLFKGLRDDSGFVLYRPLSINGELLFFGHSTTEWSLRDVNNKIKKLHRPKDDLSWTDRIAFYRHDPAEHRIILFHPPTAVIGDDVFRLAIWNYKSDSFSSYQIKLGDLFEKKGDGYFPKDVIPIEAESLKKS